MAESIAIVSRKARADSQRNRAIILEVAKRLLTEKGGGVSLDEIAQVAGVGNGTLYRHFPTRTALVQAVCREDARDLTDTATRLASTHQPLDALTAWMDAFVDCIATKQIIAEATNALLSTSLDMQDSSCADVGAALTMLFDRAVADGHIRGDFDPLDLVRAITGLATVNPHSDWVNNAKRLIAVIISGLGTKSFE
jgi:AcrR family transcriptional regulator